MNGLNPQMMGLLTAAAAGMEASGPSRMPVSTGQVMGRGLLSGLGAYQQGQDSELKRGLLGAQLKHMGFQEEVARENLEQQRLARQQAIALQQARAGMFGDPGVSPQQALSGGGGPTQANADMIRPPNPLAMNPAGVQNYLRLGGDPKVIESFQNLGPQGQLGKIDPKDYTPESFAAFMGGAGPSALRPRSQIQVAPNGVAYDPYQTAVGTTFADPNKAFSVGPNGSFVPNKPFQEYEVGKARAGAPKTVVNPAMDPFKNEKSLRDEYQGNPVVKNAAEMDAAFKLIDTAFKRPSPANDLAMATKYMKLLDPTSVVRESELALAMNATGLIDKVRSYAENIATGKKLNPTQRKDFYDSAKAINDAFQAQKTGIGGNYRRIAEQYGLKSDNVTFNPRGDGVDDIINQADAIINSRKP